MWRNLQLAFCSNQNQGLSSEQRGFVKGQLRSGSRAKWGLSLVGAVHCSGGPGGHRTPVSHNPGPPSLLQAPLVRVPNPLPRSQAGNLSTLGPARPLSVPFCASGISQTSWPSSSHLYQLLCCCCQCNLSAHCHHNFHEYHFVSIVTSAPSLSSSWSSASWLFVSWSSASWSSSWS